jgi:hypothetical protein
VLDAKEGEGASMLDLGGACEMGSFFCVWYFMHSRLLSCIILFTCDCETYMTCVLSTSIYMSCHLVMLICFASAFYSNSNEL